MALTSLVLIKPVLVGAGSSQSPELDIHTKVLFDCAEDLKDYFGALTSYIKNNDKGISFGFAIDMQGKDLGTPGGEIYVINIMAQPVVDGCLLLCSDRALPEIQSELFTADLRELCRPHVVDLYVLGQRAFDVHAHCSRLSLRHILKQQSIPKLLWNAQDLAASLSKQFKIEVSLPADDRLLLTTVSEPVASALPVATAGADEVAGVTATDSVAATTKAAATAARTDPIEAAESGKSSSPDRSVPVKARGTCGRGGRCSHIPFSVPKGTTRTPNCLCDLQLLEFKAHSIDSLSDAAGGSASFRALDECVDQYLAAKGPHAGVVLPAADEMRHDFRAQHLDLMRRLKADPDALRARPIRPKDIKYFVNCVQFLPLMHRIFEPLITLAGTDQAQQMLKAVNEATSYLVRRRTAACVSGAESDERLPDPTMEEIWSERAAKLEAPSTTTKQSAKI
ncbi:hypothetical protein SEPCBS119000_004026 [Sporothrix epigloea]|uniref:3'-5' exonuclease domain-containing protein n=1 Tax=Sporothrix epigloea TaxID=1892477 RepID=A0ABP0DTY8_9PEZI